ncbi:MULTISPECIES: hypothetical protein [Pseudoalteromonas]|uniref:hypothetical protein n=1 Tax=Pseudoalteromonas TaxID=53246 RepID=UPI00157479C6|nr:MULTISPECIES: hypothetical protein [Pseudoalteromonas]MBR8845624.1 hypothetical protein [Pseudoalteromonas sp. JC3]NSY34806.1 hypothetical protein [Pseudoalteromonas sp. JC28]QUI72619.1 hypothetical protein GSF13_24195 [Pseudoalteromonas sp. M8]UDM60033.1 hypothetical protein KIJ96_09145 [Pseudoalteromonas piscicida]WJE08833.1 hypothetical protein QSH61_18565 [Pseudoalteromonas sp. JC3]
MHNNQMLFTNIRWQSDFVFEFILDANHYLFAEHFPGFPVVPASLIMEMVYTQLAKKLKKEGCKLLINNAKFLSPMLPAPNYRCELKNKSGATYMFTISDSTGKAYNKGIISLITDSEVEYAA